MQLFLSFPFSHLTLFLFFALPFSFYLYSAGHWYQPDKVRFYNFILGTVATILALAVMLRIVLAFRFGLRADLDLIALHLAPPLLALFAIRQSAGTGIEAAIRRATQPAEQSDYKPQAVEAGDVDKVTWDDVIVNDSVRQELDSVIALLRDPASARRLGVAIPKGILLDGPPGTGKTTIAKVMANVSGLAFFALRADEIVSKWVGESEKNLSRLFEAAKDNAPSVIFIDEVDTLGKRRSDKNASHSDNLLNHLLQLIDGVVKSEGIYIIAATNRAELVDEALKRAGRLNRVIEIALPDLEARRKIVNLYASKLNLAADVDLEAFAQATEGNSPADLKEICNQAGLRAFQRYNQTAPQGKRKRRPEELQVTSEDIEAALELFEVDDSDFDLEGEERKSGLPEPVNLAVEKVSWDDLIIEQSLREELLSVIRLLEDPESARRYGIDVPKGLLLNGPPGTGKTTLAKVIANTAGLSFFILQTDEIISKWVGESEKNLTRLFKAAQRHAPSVIFIDELDSIGKNRAEGNAQHSDNLLNHLLQLIDGVIKREGVYIFAATNRADLVDPALKRGGRLNRVIEIPLPNAEARQALFGLCLKKMTIADKVDLALLARLTENKSGADIKSICNQAGLRAFQRESARGSREFKVTSNDLIEAVKDFTA